MSDMSMLHRFIKAIEREIGYRRGVYPRLVAGGKMKQTMADEQIAVMNDLLDYLRGKL